MDDLRIDNSVRPAPITETQSGKAAGTEEKGFGDYLSDSLAEVNRQIKTADDQAQAMVAGEDVSIHSTMINLEKANISLEFMLQVRNKVIEAYHEIMRMQI
jgi:flagellar hook-basal body complex protein FliE